jgi:site-specific DNA-methyltransferase (adenine-specific)
MKPYYEHAGITIYHGDCRDILPSLPKVDLVLTDPPYGVSGIQNSKSSKRKNEYGTFVDSVTYVKDVCVPAFVQSLEKCDRAILTPGNRCLTLYPPPSSFGCFWQPASVGLQPWGRADSQPIFYYGSFPGDTKQIPGNKCSFILTESSAEYGHPCPKPFNAWQRFIVLYSDYGQTILDPFMGSGTTLRGAKDLGRKAIGIEIEERYCEIAAKRMSQEVFNL